MQQNNKKQLTAFSVIVALMIVAYFALSNTGAMVLLQDSAALKQWVLNLGITGPFLIIALMTLAIIMSPIPSAPIALTAGAIYGHAEGTAYILLDAKLGAIIIAFCIARLLSQY